MTEKEIDPRITQFIARLEQLEAGEKARLKRNAGNTLAEARQTALGLFYRVLPPNVAHYQEGIYFMVATLYPLADSSGAGNLGAALRRAQDSQNKDGLDRRVMVLLDADESQLPFRLRQAIRYLYSKRVPVDWPRLLKDLLYWTHESRFVQQEWARTYFA
jgi:CRISPR system Cascade subunit CasB